MNQNHIKKIISSAVEKLKKEYCPEKIILFGSYAYGKPSMDSDIDLLIVKDTKEGKIARFVEVKRIIYNSRTKVPISPLVYTPNELKRRLKLGDDFINEIITKGSLLYEKRNSQRMV